MDGYKSEAIFYIPGFCHKLGVINNLVWAYNDNKDGFKDNVKIGCVYDSLNNIWAGGRFFFPQRYLVQELEKFRDNYKSMHIPVRLVFTNSEITEDMLKDTYSNQIADIFATGDNEILVNSPLLEQYLREKYGDKYRYCSSITKGFRLDFDNIENDLGKYFTTVIDYNKNHDFGYLQSLTHKDNIEILVNASCKEHCPYAAKHYKEMSIQNIDCDANHNTFFNEHCPVIASGENNEYFYMKERKHYISTDEIDRYLNIGINKFKIEGRHLNYEALIPILLDYLIKDKSKLEMYYVLYNAYSVHGDLMGDMVPKRHGFYFDGIY